MLKQFNDHSVRRANVCKASTDILSWLCEDLAATLTNRFDGLVHVVNVQTEVPDAVSVLIDAVSIRRRNDRLGALGIRLTPIRRDAGNI
jgi:hypothetical protein